MLDAGIYALVLPQEDIDSRTFGLTTQKNCCRIQCLSGC